MNQPNLAPPWVRLVNSTNSGHMIQPPRMIARINKTGAASRGISKTYMCERDERNELIIGMLVGKCQAILA